MDNPVPKCLRRDFASFLPDITHGIFTAMFDDGRQAPWLSNSDEVDWNIHPDYTEMDIEFNTNYAHGRIVSPLVMYMANNDTGNPQVNEGHPYLDNQDLSLIAGLVYNKFYLKWHRLAMSYGTAFLETLPPNVDITEIYSANNSATRSEASSSMLDRSGTSETKTEYASNETQSGAYTDAGLDKTYNWGFNTPDSGDGRPTGKVGHEMTRTYGGENSPYKTEHGGDDTTTLTNALSDTVAGSKMSTDDGAQSYTRTKHGIDGVDLVDQVRRFRELWTQNYLDHIYNDTASILCINMYEGRY